MDKRTAIGLVLCLLVGVGIGRFSLPSKISITKQVEETKDKQSQTQQQDRSITTVTETTKPDGSKTKTTVIAKNIDKSSESASSDNKQSKSDKETTYAVRDWSISVIASAHPLSSLHPEITYGGEVTYRLIGPLQVGGLFLTDGTVGVLLGITF